MARIREAAGRIAWDELQPGISAGREYQLARAEMPPHRPAPDRSRPRRKRRFGITESRVGRLGWNHAQEPGWSPRLHLLFEVVGKGDQGGLPEETAVHPDARGPSVGSDADRHGDVRIAG